MEKKGFFFTLLVFIFFFLILVSITTWTRVKEPREERIVIDIRVKKMNEFATMLREDSVRMTQLTGFNALKCVSKYVASNLNRLYLNNSRCLGGSCIYELVYNATVENNETYVNWDGSYVNFSDEGQMGSLTLKNWDIKIKQLADKSDFNLNLSRDNIAVYQSDPWNVKIGYNLYFNISDKALDTVSRSEVVPVLATVPIANYTYGD